MPVVPFNVNVPICTSMTEDVVTFDDGVPISTRVTSIDAYAVVNVQWPDEAGRVNQATLVSTKVDIITFPNATGPVIAHLTIVYDYNAQTNTVTIHSNSTHITTQFGADTSRVWFNGDVAPPQGTNWSLNLVPNITAMLHNQLIRCQDVVVRAMCASPAAYNVNVI